MSPQRYTPRHGRAVAVATPVAAEVVTDEIVAPGVAALLRRNPATVRHGAIASICAGLMLFGIGQSTGSALAISHIAAATAMKTSGGGILCSSDGMTTLPFQLRRR